jgi:hypothetical protein
MPKFCEDFDLDSADKQELEDIVVAKSKNVRNPLFSQEQKGK